MKMINDFKKNNNNLFILVSIAPLIIGFSIEFFFNFFYMERVIVFCYLLSFIMLCYFFFSNILLKKTNNLKFLEFDFKKKYKIFSILGLILGIINIKKDIINYSISTYLFLLIICFLILLVFVKLKDKNIDKE
ncbi:hypothetical protein [Flavobacterium sp. PL002]